VHIGEQIVQVLLAQGLAVARHFFAAETNNVADALVVRRQPADCKILVLKYSFETRAFLASRGIRFMAAVAVIVVDFSAGGLLWIQAKLGIGLAALDVTAAQRR